MKQNILYLASQSTSRHDLLKLASIPFHVISHASSEQISGSFEDFTAHVTAIAQDKMRHAVLPESARAHKEVFVMTADTLVRTTRSNKILGKPRDRQEAQLMLELSRNEPVEVVTVVCIERRAIHPSIQFFAERKITQDERVETRTIVSRSIIEFCVSSEQVDTYFTKEPAALLASGAAVIEGYGLVFLKSIQGSFTGVLGLPLFEVQQALVDLGF